MLNETIEYMNAIQELPVLINIYKYYQDYKC